MLAEVHTRNPYTGASELNQLSQAIRHIILRQSKRANVGHIGSALSIVDIIAALSANVLKAPAADFESRDRFVLSKGHAALAMYAALYLQGRITREELETFCSDGTYMGVHPEHKLAGVDFSTGSLGQGLTFGAGSALAARIKRESWRSYVLLSDAECNEGSTWEAVMFAAHQQLGNLVAIVDLNGQQAMGYTRDVLALPDMHKRWEAFGWNAHLVDGHNPDEILRLLENLEYDSGVPNAVIALTTFGKGVSFMESDIKWHYLPMNEEHFRHAVADIEVLG